LMHASFDVCRWMDTADFAQICILIVTLNIAANNCCSTLKGKIICNYLKLAKLGIAK